MKIDWLKPLLGHPGPFATVYIDATRANEAGDREVGNRWKGVRRQLHQDGAPDEVLDDLEEVVVRPTRVAGAHGRVLIADDTGVLVDRVLKDPPALTKGVWGPVPALLQAARAADESVDYVRVVVDRQGADLTWSVAGGHRPDLVLLTGDVRAVSLLRGALKRPVEELVVEVPGGGRGPGINEAAFEANVADALDSFREGRREKVLAEYRQEQGRESGAVTSVEDVVAVLARGQVSELVLADEYGQDGALDDRSLWIGPSPLHIAGTKEEIQDLGVSEGLERLPATVALVRAAIGQDAGLTFAPEGSVELIEGVGATLRWTDEGTPREVAATMSGDDARLRGEII